MKVWNSSELKKLNNIQKWERPFQGPVPVSKPFLHWPVTIDCRSVKVNQQWDSCFKKQRKAKPQRKPYSRTHVVNISLCQQLGSIQLIKQCRPKASTASSRFHIIVECLMVTFDQDARICNIPEICDTFLVKIIWTSFRGCLDCSWRVSVRKNQNESFFWRVWRREVKCK